MLSTNHVDCTTSNVIVKNNVSCCCCCCNSGKSYDLTMHEYIVYEYLTRYNFKHFPSILKKNEHNFVQGNKFLVGPATTFIVENLDLFTDAKLAKQIYNEALLKFPSVKVGEIVEPFSEEFKRIFLDYKHQFGGVNLMNFSKSKSFEELFTFSTSPEITQHYSTEENEHYKEFLLMIKNENSLSSMIKYFTNTRDTSKFSRKYLAIIDFAINTLKFYEEERESILAIDLKTLIRLAILGYSLGWDIGWIRQNDGTPIEAAVASHTQSVCSIIVDVCLDVFADSNIEEIVNS